MTDRHNKTRAGFLSNMIARMQRIRGNVSRVLSMNHRNLGYIYPHNQRVHYPLADNKLYTKQMLANTGVPLPETYKVYGYFYELRHLNADLSQYSDFVIKPAMGSGGGGIVVISGRSEDGKLWLAVDGTAYSVEDLRKHISDIIFGVYSFGLSDEAIIEERISQHPGVVTISPYGLADVRMIVCKNQPILAMIRLATRKSHGTANLHQGAVGVGIDLETGITQHATQKGHPISHHPDSGVALTGVQLPCWPAIIDAGIRVSNESPLKYLGVDIAIAEDGPRLLEINVRPGLEIQNANACGMREILENYASE
jgi:alpha-L-glutamate ligase-like protein